MARPTKQGIDFFSLDVNDDDKLDLFIAEVGAEGYGILITLWKLIYRGHGYFIEDNDDLVLLLRKRTFSAAETIVSVIKTATRRGIFSEKLHSEYQILTSSGIQKRFFPAAKKKKEVIVRPELLLISVSEYKNIVFDSGNEVPASGNATKEKEQEKEKVKEEDSYESFPENFLKSVFRDEAYKFSDWFAEKLKPGNLKLTKTLRNQWAMVWFHLRETDKRENVEEMSAAIEWARGDPFWTTNFKSPLKLRRKNSEGIMYIDVFIEQFRKHQNGRGNGKVGSCTPDQFNELLGWIKSNPAIPA